MVFGSESGGEARYFGNARNGDPVGPITLDGHKADRFSINFYDPNLRDSIHDMLDSRTMTTIFKR